MLDQQELNVAGSPSLTVAGALAAMEKLCKQNLTHEAKALLELSFARFKDIRNTLQGHGDSAIFVRVLGQFYKKMLAHSSMSLAARVIDCKYLLKELTTMHHGSNSLDTVCQVLRGRYAPWTQLMAFNDAKAAYEAKLDKAVDIAIASWKANLVINKAVVEQSDRELQCARCSKDALRWDQNGLAKKMEAVVRRLTSEAVGLWLQSKRPSWFIAEDEIRYQTEIGRGSFYVVYTGTWGTQDGGIGGAEVVIKKQILSGDESAMEKQRVAFVKEVSLWAPLKHPYILKIFGANCNTDELFMVCEYAENGDLASHLSTSDGKRRTWRHLYHTALGIAYLHEKSIVHGNLKLDKFVVGRDGYPRVMSSITTREKLSSKIYAVRQQVGDVSAGALRWRAPECVGADAVEPQLSSDVYSFGICIYEVYKGPLYGFLDHQSAAEMIKKGELPRKPTDIPDEVWYLIKKMTCKEPSERITMHAVTMELWPLAEKERRADEEEKQDKLVCTACNADIPQNSGSHCPHCHKVVKTARLEIASRNDLPRVNELLVSQSVNQKRDAMKTLQSYICRDLVQQKEVYEPNVISVLACIIKSPIEDEDIQREALVTLECVVVGIEAAQIYAMEEQVVTRLVQILRDGPESLKCKAANTLGYLTYRNTRIYDAVLKEKNLLDMIEKLQPTNEKSRRDKNRALKMLTPRRNKLGTASEAYT